MWSRRFLVSAIVCLSSILCLGKTITISQKRELQKQFSTKSAIYVIKSHIDLGGDTLRVPEKSVLKFRRRGYLSNGVVLGDCTSFNKLSSKPRFSNLQFAGTFNIASIPYTIFGDYDDDTKLLNSMFGLLFSSVVECTLELEPDRSYNIDGAIKKYGHAIYEYYDKSYKTINGNNSTINDLRTRAKVGYKTYDGVFLFSACHDLTINKLNYQNLNEDYVEIRECQQVKYKSGIENQLGYVGYAFIMLQDDCSNINISSHIIGARYGVKYGDYSEYWVNGSNGLVNSKLEIDAKRTGYPVAIELGDSLDIFVHSEIHHRAAYLCGVSHSSIEIKAKDIYIAPYHCLLSDTHYSKRGKGKPLFKSCSDVTVNFTELGSSIATSGDCYCVGLQTYDREAFFLRDKELVWNNININIRKSAPASKVGLFAICRSYPQTKNSPLRFHDEFRNIDIVAEDNFESEQYCFRIRLNEYGVYDNVNIRVNAPYATAIYDNCSSYSFDLSNVVVRSLYYAGKVNIPNELNARTMRSTLK